MDSHSWTTPRRPYEQFWRHIACILIVAALARWRTESWLVALTVGPIVGTIIAVFLEIALGLAEDEGLPRARRVLIIVLMSAATLAFADMVIVGVRLLRS